MSRENRRTDTDLAEIPPEIEKRLSEWEDALALIDQTGRVDFFDLNAKRWDLGRRMVSTLDAVGEEGITSILQAVARRLGKSRTYLYHMMWVARAWPDDLPRRPWTVLRKLSRLPKAQRDELEKHLPLDCSAKDIPSPKKEPNLTPQARADKEFARRAEAFEKAALDAYSQLEPLVQAYFLADRIREFDLSRARDEAEGKRLLGMIAEALESFGQDAPDRGDVSAPESPEEDDDVFDV